MPKNKTITGIVITLLLLMFGFGVFHLFVLRFESGDVYPAYSSLRSDPLGTRALYASLANLDNVQVRRNYLWRESLSFEPRTTLFYLGASADSFDSVPEATMRVFDRLTQSGGRLVLTFLPVTRKHDNETPQGPLSEQEKVKPSADQGKGDKLRHSSPPDGDRSSAESSNKTEPSETDDHLPPDSGEPVPTVSIEKHWGIGIAFKEMLPVKDDKRLALDAVSSRRGFPSFISWHSNLYFELSDNSWQTIYSFDGLPLIVERPYGKGSIVVCADSFFVSNEALLSERHPRLLVWLIGGHANLVFDEAHLGLFRQPSVAQLIRHYRFHWFFAALAVMALLFVWKSAVYFIPPPEETFTRGAEVISEKDYTQGLVALLRRNFPADQILQICVREWVQTFKKNRHIKAGTFDQIRGIAGIGSSAGSKKGRNAADAFQKISRVISRGKGI